MLDWFTERNVPLLSGIVTSVSGLTSNFPAMGMGLVSVAFLWLMGLNRTALAFASEWLRSRMSSGEVRDACITWASISS